MKSNRGFTTLELMVATAITMVAIVAVCTLLIESGHFTRNNEEIIKSNDGARIAGEFIVGALRVAGVGGAAGVWINNAGTPKLISPIFGTDAIAAEGNTDDIWMVLPDRRAFKESNCALNSGSAASLVAGGPGPLNVGCTQSLMPPGLPNPSLLLLANFAGSAALLTAPRVTAASDGTVVGVIDYGESALPGFPPRAFQQGDGVFGASVVHFFVHRDSSGSALYRETGVLSGASPPAFVAGTASRTVLQSNIEDLQIAYGVDPSGAGQPDQYVFQNGFPDAFGSILRAVRVSVVAYHDRPMRSGDTSALIAFQPISPLENHDQTGAPKDAFRRSLYTRRIELPNLSPGML